MELSMIIMQADVLGNALIPPVVSIIAFATLVGIIWNISRRFTTLELDAKVGKEQHYSDIKELKDRLNQLDKDSIQRLADTKVERREEIAKALSASLEKFESHQKQIDGSRSDMKDVSTRVTQVNTKTEYIEQQIVELKKCDQINFDFHTNWNQRVEDSIKDVRTEMGLMRSEFLHMFTGFHGKGSNKSTNQ